MGAFVSFLFASIQVVPCPTAPHRVAIDPGLIKRAQSRRPPGQRRGGAVEVKRSPGHRHRYVQSALASTVRHIPMQTSQSRVHRASRSLNAFITPNRLSLVNTCNISRLYKAPSSSSQHNVFTPTHTLQKSPPPHHPLINMSTPNPVQQSQALGIDLRACAAPPGC